MRKRVLCILIALAMVLALMPGVAFADVLPEGATGWVDGNGTIPVWYKLEDNNATLTIGGTGPMPDFGSKDDAPWQLSRDYESIETIIIGDNVTSIGDFAFSDFSGLTSVIIYGSITKIGDQAFAGCESLASITIPDSVTTIGVDAFRGCSSLASIIIPASVTSVGGYAFSECSALATVTFSETSQLTTIGEWTFDSCGLTSIVIPESVTDIKPSAFSNCTALTAFTVADGNTKYEVGDGVLYNKGITTLVQYPAGKTDTSFVIPASITEIKEYAFNGCSKLNTVTFEEGSQLTAIGSKAFFSLFSLKEIAIPTGVTSIEERAFQNCTSLVSITIPSGVTSVGNYAFGLCSSLADVTCLATTPPTLYTTSFYSCSSLASLQVPAGSVDAYRAASGWNAYASKIVGACIHNVDGFTAWGNNDGETTSLPSTAGSYYLTEDVTLSETWTVKAGSAQSPAITNLCLNGHVIKANCTDANKFSVITVPVNATLNLYDCGTTEHKGYIDADGLWHLAAGGHPAEGETEKNITGGVITGGNNATDGGGGVHVEGTFSMNGGNIVGNMASNTANGGGVIVHTDATFTMNGGAITENVTQSAGGGVCCSSTFNMLKGKIASNKAALGGGVYIFSNDNSCINMSGGYITGNTASNNGGGVCYAVKGAVTLGGTAQITGNFKGTGEDAAENNLYLGSNKHITLGTKSGSEEGNGVVAPADGMSVGVTMATPGTFTETATETQKGYFSSDNSGYEVAFNTDHLELKKTVAPAPEYTTYQHWQIKHEGSEWQWTDNMTKVEDGLFKLEVNWTGSGFNVKSDENLIKKDWYAPEDLTVGEEVIAPVTVDVYLRVIDDETLKIGVGVVPSTGETAEITTWSDLQNAINEATKPTTIQLTQDLTVPAEDGERLVIPAGKNIVLDLNGFTLDRGLKNEDTAFDKGNVFTVNGKLTIQDNSTAQTGKITGGTSAYGAAIISNGETILESGTITGCKATSTDYDATNSQLGRGGAIYVNKNGKFTMTGGEIKNCSASVAGGAIFNIGTVNIAGGKIDGCSVSGVNDGGTVKAKGGAVYNFATSHFTMTGGEISGNRLSKVADMRGAGVYAAAGANVTLGGTAKITDNTNGDNKASNLFLYDGVSFTVSTDIVPGAGMNVGVTTKTAPTSGNPVQIGTTATDYSSFFFADGSGYGVVFNANKNVLEFAVVPVYIGNVEVKDNEIKTGDTTVTVKDANGNDIESGKLEDVAKAINEILDNKKVNNFGKTTDETGIEKATEANNSKIVDALKAETTDSTAKAAVTDTGISKYLNVTLVSADVDVDTTDGTTVTVNKLVFDVTPMATITVAGKDGTSVTLTTEITKDEINSDVTFLLPVDSKNTAPTAAVYHENDFLGNYQVNTSGDSKYLEVTTKSFSNFGYITLDATTAGAMIDDTYYASLSDAVSKVANNETITLLKAASGNITVSRAVQFTINENSNTNNATIVAGSGYKLSKSGDTYTITVSGGGSTGGGSTSSYAVELPANVKNGKINVSPKNASAGSTVKITVTPDKGFTLETLTVLDNNGKEAEVKNLGNNKYSFKMPNGKVTIKASFMEDNAMLNFFVDVKATDYFYDSVLWAAENKITAGTDAIHFNPNGTTTRGQMITFLWRMAGSPVFEDDDIKFVDIKKKDYFYNAVVWGWNMGIVSGKSATAFAPDDKVTRGEAVTFIYRYAKVAGGDLPNPFNDVKQGAFYYYPVLWAANNGITSGVNATTFNPSGDCTRAQVVTFLYRFNEKFN